MIIELLLIVVVTLIKPDAFAGLSALNVNDNFFPRE